MFLYIILTTNLFADEFVVKFPYHLYKKDEEYYAEVSRLDELLAQSKKGKQAFFITTRKLSASSLEYVKIIYCIRMYAQK